MRIQIVTHTTRENLDRMTGRWSILPKLFSNSGNKVEQIIKNDWLLWPFKYFKFKPDIIITAGPFGAFVSLLRKIGFVKVKVIHDWNDNYSEIMGKKWGKGFVNFLEEYTIKNSDFVVSCSYYRLERAKNEFGKIEGENLFYIAHGYHEEYFKSFKKINFPGKHKIKILYVGEQSKIKKVDKLIKEFKNINADLILIGNTNEEFKANSSENIHFLGKKNSEEVPSYLKSSDFLIITEDNDSALKLIEYLKSDKPILVPNGRIAKYFKDGRIIKYNLNATKINKILYHKVKLRKDCVEIYSWKEINKKYLNTLNSIISNA